MSTIEQPTAEELASFSWGGQRARPRKGQELVMMENATYLKPPGSLLSKWPGLGVAVEVECCTKSNIYILDPCERVQISECVDCRIVVGPCVGSIMLFECKNCVMTVASKQIRLRDCFDCELRIFCPAHEGLVIETSKRLKIGGWDVAYPGLAAQFAMTGWFSEPNGYVNHANAVFDFSPPPGGGKNWIAVGACSPGRWCELVVNAVEGLTGGKVSEARVDEPTTQGAECPCPGPDGAKYEAVWFSATAHNASQLDAKAADADAVPAITKGASLSAGKRSSAAAAASSAPPSKKSLFSRVFGWLFGGKSASSDAPVDLVDVKVTGKETQVCAIM